MRAALEKSNQYAAFNHFDCTMASPGPPKSNESVEKAVVNQLTALVSDIPGLARFTDGNLVNPWGVVIVVSRSDDKSASRTVWVADNGTGLLTAYDTKGVSKGTVVAVQLPKCTSSATATPTGLVVNNTSGFAPPGAPAPLLITCTEDGTINTFTPSVNPKLAPRVVDNSCQPADATAPAVYKGLAIATCSRRGPLLFVANFRSGFVEVYNTKFRLIQKFTDQELRATGWGPFNVAAVERGADHKTQNGKKKGQSTTVLVSFALQDDARHDDAQGPARGYIDEFDLSGKRLRRVTSQGPLNSPWALVPLGRTLSGVNPSTLLVGNFGSGRIVFYDFESGRFLAELRLLGCDFLQVPGLWGVAVLEKVKTPCGVHDELLFAAGINQEAHGLLARLHPQCATCAARDDAKPAGLVCKKKI